LEPAKALNGRFSVSASTAVWITAVEASGFLRRYGRNTANCVTASSRGWQGAVPAWFEALNAAVTTAVSPAPPGVSVATRGRTATTRAESDSNTCPAGISTTVSSRRRLRSAMRTVSRPLVVHWAAMCPDRTPSVKVVWAIPARSSGVTPAKRARPGSAASPAEGRRVQSRARPAAAMSVNASSSALDPLDLNSLPAMSAGGCVFGRRGARAAPKWH